MPIFNISGADGMTVADTTLEKNFCCGVIKKHSGQEMR